MPFEPAFDCELLNVAGGDVELVFHEPVVDLAAGAVQLVVAFIDRIGAVVVGPTLFLLCALRQG